MFGFGLLQSATTSSSSTETPTLYTGTNLVSMESCTYDQYDPASGPPTGNYPNYTQAMYDFLFTTSGAKAVRITFSWEAVQNGLGTADVPPSGSNYQAYWNRLMDMVDNCLSRGCEIVLLEPWGYNATSGDTDLAYQGGIFTADDLGYFWSLFASAVNTHTGNNQRVHFGMINEPHAGATVAGSAVTDFTPFAQSIINYIRGTGATNRIYYTGYNYGDCYNFVSNGSMAEFLTLTDSQNNLGIQVHNYNGQGVGDYNSNPSNANNTTALADAIDPVVQAVRAYESYLGRLVPVFVGEIAIDAGSSNGSLTVAQDQWAYWQAYCVTNKDVICGWTWWAASKSMSGDNWWSNSDSRGGFNWGLIQASTDDQTASVYHTLIASTLGAW